MRLKDQIKTNKIRINPKGGIAIARLSSRFAVVKRFTFGYGTIV